jgi:hypothetical protein
VKPGLLAAALCMILVAKAPAAGLTARVYPSGPEVPENLLRIELRFSAPLRHPLALEHVKLVDESGRVIEGAFLDLPLPAADASRVTLLLHPGRVKTGLVAQRTFGRALQAGTRMTLVIEDAALARPVRKTWQVVGFDAQPPAPSLWRFKQPTAGTRTPLLVHLDAPISSTAEALIAVRGPDGNRVAGNSRLEVGETVWRLTPARAWHAGLYALVTHPELEDAAGNRPCAAFEAARLSQARCEDGTALPFVVGETTATRKSPRPPASITDAGAERRTALRLSR